MRRPWRSALCVTLVLFACGNDDGAARDGGVSGSIDAQPCRDDDECNGTYDEPIACRGGECSLLCAGVDGGHACNYGFASDFPSECCTPDETCCEVGFEHEECRAGPCPRLCLLPGNFTEVVHCLVEQRCGYSAVIPDAGPLAPDAGMLDAGPPQCKQYDGTVECMADCPQANRCGLADCCLAGTVCNGSCCVPQ